MAKSLQSYASTYFVQDQPNKEEFLRLADKDRLVTASMGGVLAEQANPAAFRRVLDIACGTGGWAIEAAQTYPTMSLVGIDINPHVIEYARAKAAEQHVDDRVEFRVMDALNILDFPTASFDLINLRFALSFARTWEWPRMLSDWLRILRPDGVVRITDEEVIHQSTSPASMQFYEMLLCALYQSGHLFTRESTGLTSHLASLLTQRGYRQVLTRAYTLQYRARTPEGEAYTKDEARKLRTLRPFLEKWGCVKEDYDTIRQQASKDIAQPDFSATWHLLTAWATKSLPKPQGAFL